MTLISCSTVRETSSGLKVKGNSTSYIFKDNSIVEGYVYSRLDSIFLEYANITIDKKRRIGTTSNEKGYFQINVDSGKYSIECFKIGHSPEIIKNIKIDKGYRKIILFELGADIIY